MADHGHKSGHHSGSAGSDHLNKDGNLERRHSSYTKPRMASMTPQSGIKIPMKGKVVPLGGTA